MSLPCVIPILAVVLTGLLSAASPEDEGEKSVHPQVATTDDAIELPEEPAKLIELLGNEKFSIRQAARKKLEDIGEKQAGSLNDLLIRTYATTDNAEIRCQAHEILLTRLLPGFLGVNYGAGRLPDGKIAILVRAVVPGEAADQAGIKTGDYITSIDGHAISEQGPTPTDFFAKHVQSRGPGQKLKVQLQREGRAISMDVTLGRMKLDVLLPSQRNSQSKALEAGFEKRLAEWQKKHPELAPKP